MAVEVTRPRRIGVIERDQQLPLMRLRRRAGEGDRLRLLHDMVGDVAAADAQRHALRGKPPGRQVRLPVDQQVEAVRCEGQV
jgi:hypothetical protein